MLSTGWRSSRTTHRGRQWVAHKSARAGIARACHDAARVRARGDRPAEGAWGGSLKLTRTRALYASQAGTADRFPTLGGTSRCCGASPGTTSLRWYDSLGSVAPDSARPRLLATKGRHGPGRHRGPGLDKPMPNLPGAGRSTRQRRIEPASLPKLAAMVEGMQERLPVARRAGAWCAPLRYGELGGCDGTTSTSSAACCRSRVQACPVGQAASRVAPVAGTHDGVAPPVGERLDGQRPSVWGQVGPVLLSRPR